MRLQWLPSTRTCTSALNLHLGQNNSVLLVSADWVCRRVCADRSVYTADPPCFCPRLPHLLSLRLLRPPPPCSPLLSARAAPHLRSSSRTPAWRSRASWPPRAASHAGPARGAPQSQRSSCSTCCSRSRSRSGRKPPRLGAHESVPGSASTGKASGYLALALGSDRTSRRRLSHPSPPFPSPPSSGEARLLSPISGPEGESSPSGPAASAMDCYTSLTLSSTLVLSSSLSRSEVRSLSVPSRLSFALSVSSVSLGLVRRSKEEG